MQKHLISGLPVMGKGKIVGIVTTTENETLAQALEKMINYGIGRLLVVDSEKNLKGIISRTDIGMALRRYRELSETQD